eukprot:493720-Rhodomonas_salina.3
MAAADRPIEVGIKDALDRSLDLLKAEFTQSFEKLYDDETILACLSEEVASEQEALREAQAELEALETRNALLKAKLVRPLRLGTLFLHDFLSPCPTLFWYNRDSVTWESGTSTFAAETDTEPRRGFKMLRCMVVCTRRLTERACRQDIQVRRQDVPEHIQKMRDDTAARLSRMEMEIEGKEDELYVSPPQCDMGSVLMVFESNPRSRLALVALTALFRRRNWR